MVSERTLPTPVCIRPCALFREPKLLQDHRSPYALPQTRGQWLSRDIERLSCTDEKGSYGKGMIVW